MANPYEVLGVSKNATDEEIKEAYRALARKYQADNYSGSPLSDIAKRKMDELDGAYDAIMLERRRHTGPGGYYGAEGYGGYSHADSQFPDVRSIIGSGRIDDAEVILDGIPQEGRGAEWYFLKGQVQQRRGWFDEAYRSYSRACQLDPQNSEYSSAFNRLNNNAGGYRQTRSVHAGCGVCDLCTTLLCADTCCECLGGDLIPGC